MVANEGSIDSVMVAKRYMRLRGIPEENLVRVTLPEELGVGVAPITTNAFRSLIWEPVQAAVAERGLGRQILCWVYSTDFPYRVKTHPEVSLTGYTFMRGELPEDLVRGLGNPVKGEKGEGYDARLTMIASPLFGGPEHVEAPGAPESKTFEQWRVTLLEEMPLPSMMLGWTGPGGNTVDEVLDCLKRGRASDGTHPEAPMCVYTNADVRSTAREWEVSPMVREVERVGGALEVVEAFPEAGMKSGFLTGVVDVPESGMEFVPGAYADHFTSHAATFHVSHQTKLSEWIRRGATASSGTVTEPYAYWQKFPHASLFVHQLRGCTMVEAIYQSVRCPVQLLPVGDPLSRPWGRHPKVVLSGAGDGVLKGVVVLRGATDQAEVFRRFEWLVDGVVVSQGAVYELDTTKLTEGEHRVRVVARSRGPVRDCGYAEVKVRVENAHGMD